MDRIYIGTLRRPAIEDGKRIIHITNFNVVHPLQLTEDTVIGAGDGQLIFSKDITLDKIDERCRINKLFYGDISKEKLEKMTEKENIGVVPFYNRREVDIPDDMRDCIFKEHSVYIKEGERSRCIYDNLSRRPRNSFIYSYFELGEIIQGMQNKESNLHLLKQKLLNNCRENGIEVRGNLSVIVDDDGAVDISMDDDFFLSLETFV